jgi:hypothetical protein
MTLRRFFQVESLLAWALAAGTPALADMPIQEPRGHPFVSASYTILPSADLASAETEGEVETKENRLAAGLLQFELGDTGFDLGLDYQYTRYMYENIDGRHRDLHRLQIPLGFNHGEESWNISGFLAPGVATSSNVMKDIFDRGSGDDYIVTGRVEGSFRLNPRLNWLAGVAYDRAFGEPKPYPVLGLLYHPDARLEFRFAVPDPAVEYRPSDRHRLSLRLFPAGFEWHVVSDEANDDFDYEVEAWRLQAVWSYRFAGSFWLDLSAGYEFDRRHAFVDDTGTSIDADVDSQWLISAGLRWGDGPLPYTHEVAH